MQNTQSEPLRGLPADMPPAQAAFLDAIRYTYEMAKLAYKDLCAELVKRTAEYSPVGAGNTNARAFLSAWSIVDSLNRLRELLSDLPGVKGRDSHQRRLFLDGTRDVEELRHVVQHLRGEVSSLANMKLPVLGRISWTCPVDGDRPLVRCCVLYSGRVVDGSSGVLPSPSIGTAMGRFSNVVLECSKFRVDLGACALEMEKVIESLDRSIRPQIQDRPAACSDLMIAVDIEQRR